jgi:hypothetical protein
MAFKVVSASIDLIKKEATIIAKDPSTAAGDTTIKVLFYYEPMIGEYPSSSARVIQEAKQILQQALSEI